MRPAHSKEVFRGELLRLEVERWTDPERSREVVRHPGAAAVVAITDDRRVVLVRQLREPVRERLLEVPAGIYDVDGEDAEGTVRRELVEETGYRVLSLAPLGRIFTSPGFADEAIDLFLGRAARPVGSGPATEEGIEVVELPFDEAARAAAEGRIADAKTALALLLARERLGPQRSATPPGEA